MSLFGRLFQPAEEQRLIGWVFIKLLALIYLGAFTSLAVQIPGLVGPQGILPLGDQLEGSYQELGRSAWLWLPTIFWWFEPTDAALQGAALLGILLSLVLLLSGQRQRLALVGLFILYLSLYHAGQLFTNFQWDALLLEAGFLSIFLLGGPNRLLIFLFEWLLFRLRFMSGFFKLVSGDPSWSGFSALNYYFETQPLPHLGAWYFHHLPDWMIWFVPTQQLAQMVWFGDLIRRLHEGSPSVVSLMAHNPFPEAPPRYLRVQSYRYRFSTAEEHAQSGNWWTREYLGLFPQVEPRKP